MTVKKSFKRIVEYRKSSPSQEKTVFTEKRLKDMQTELFENFKTCKKSCTGDCAPGKCDAIVRNMAKALTPYGESIFKRSFKKRATLEEMYRVVLESINALLMDVWDREKVIHTSWGALLKYKMLHFLDGKINLFDIRTKTYSVESSDALHAHFENSGEISGADVIDYMSDNYVSPLVNEKRLIKKNTIDVIYSIVESFFDRFTGYLKNDEKTRVTLKVYLGIDRFFKGHHNYSLFKGDPKSKFYYVKLLDEIFEYLRIYKKLN